MPFSHLKLSLVLWIICCCSTFAQEQTRSFELAGNQIDLTYSSNNHRIEVDVTNVNRLLEIATITIKSEQSFIPQKLALKWSTPSSNIAGYWSTSAFLDKTISPDWGPAKVTSMLARHAPVICLYGYDDTNRQTFAVSEALNTVITSTAVNEETGMIFNEVQLFTEKHKAVLEYKVQFRLDTRAINYATALDDVNSWWESFDLYKPAPVPEAAKLPVYSTWYSYHQNVSSEAILQECKKAKAMGYQTVIVDDGWQTLDSNRGYAYTGDWNPDRLTDMKALVEEVHKLGMKFVLWYAVPFVGEKSKAFDQMQGKFLTYWDGQGTYVVDPRFPEVRTFIINTYLKAVEEWNLDGFKLDFIGRFRAVDDTRLVAEDGRDFASVNEATDKLMTDLIAALRDLKPDILLEFRQPYTGPLMKKYGNMLRASDCPNVAMVNRVETTDLRLISGATAVHADMLMWHYEEPVEVAALQFLNVLYSVPQISVRLGDIPTDHFEMIRFYSNYWLENRQVLLGGKFFASNPHLNYPMLAAHTAKKKIITVFDDRTVDFDSSYNSFDVVNAKPTTRIVMDVHTANEKAYKYTIYDCLGRVMASKEVSLTNGIHKFEVPPSGLIKFVKN